MKRWIALLLLSALAIWQVPAQAQGRAYSQAELDALLAPVALYPDPVLSHILVASTYPDDLREAAAWSRANSHLTGEDAVRAADPMLWPPSVKALVAFPDLLARMDESPQWTADLGAAFLEQEPYVMDTVQALRRRAQASGYLQSSDQYSVQQQGSSIAVYPTQPQIVYVPYYDPYVVYGPWPRDPYRPVFWRPWHPRPAVFVSTHFFARPVDWHRRHVVRHVVRHHAAAAQKHHPQDWRSDRPPRREVHRARTGPAAPVTTHDHAQPVRPIVNSVGIQPLPVRPPVHSPLRPIGEPVRPIGVPVRPIVDSVRIQPQPAAQLRRSEARREFQRDLRVQASPPVIVQNQAQAVRPIVESVRIHPQPAAQTHRPQVRGEFRHPARPSGQSGHVRQPQRQAEQRRR